MSKKSRVKKQIKSILELVSNYEILLTIETMDRHNIFLSSPNPVQIILADTARLYFLLIYQCPYLGHSLLKQVWFLLLDGFPVCVFDDVVVVVFAILQGAALQTLTRMSVGQHQNGGHVDWR